VRLRRRHVLALPALIGSARAQDNVPSVRIGVLWDRTGIGAVTSGLDQLVAARLAVDDFGAMSRGYPVEVLDAEFIRRPDEAVSIARRWFERDGVAGIVDVPGMAAAAQVQTYARSVDRTVMNTGSLNAALTEAACSPTATHWMEDTKALTLAMTVGMAVDGAKSWFLVVPDEVLSLALEAGAAAAIERTGGRLLGSARHPADGSAFAQALDSARASGADAIGLCSYGALLEAQLREARSGGLFENGRAVCAYAASIRDIHSAGAPATSDLRIVSGFYWDLNDSTRSFSDRFNRLTGRMPDKPHAATYAAIEHFLRTVEATDTIDGTALNIGMRREPAYFFGAGGVLRFDGKLLTELNLYRVKQPDSMTDAWDLYRPIRTISARSVFPPPVPGACPLPP